ncbi:testis-specific serine/threonine-protein kinase 4-like [Athalia rosae]|uniref:testis-specific serine/threonine-protein kinase 4-like n=1 Tax=Athalia rosae TaxID=37344 RepID=UPI00203477CC|nr:testis-specific serine/threonine-protein kinase 4-like [Athalia rosae]
MAALPIIADPKAKPQKNDGGSKNGEKSDKKLTVLETHGYTLGQTIGTGSYATVKVAKSERHGCRVAVKIVSKFQAPGDYLKKFLPREIEVVKGLRHPNLIRFLQAIETTHRVYIVMEFAQNGSLLDVIRRDSHIDEGRGRRWFRQLIDAVDYCHERGVVHRDIKCENLLIDSAFNIKLSDFGFARGHMKPKNGIAPLSETFCGSYAYASPEILRGVPYQPQLSDIWSMGVVLYTMVYGRLPFDDTNYAQLLKQVQNKVTFPKEPKVSSECRALITRILAPQSSRLRIAIIRNDSWLAASIAVAQTSTTDYSMDLPAVFDKGMEHCSEKEVDKILKKDHKQLSTKLKVEEKAQMTDAKSDLAKTISSTLNVDFVEPEKEGKSSYQDEDLA